MMVVGLVLFGIYAALAPLREGDTDGVDAVDGASGSPSTKSTAGDA